MEEESWVEEREAEMMASLAGRGRHQEPTKRKAFFLKPLLCCNHGEPSFPPQHDATPSGAGEAEKNNLPPMGFWWWAEPQHRWPYWVKKLEPIYKEVWQRVGIYEAVVASTIKIRKESSSLWGIIRFWRDDTNTFVFPWGEATLTLQDAMVLGGFPVLGEPVRPVEGEAGVLESEFDKELLAFKRKFTSTQQFMWVKHYVDAGQGDEVEHVAFLSLWLSRYVLRSSDGNGKTIRGAVIQIACKLARGIRVALAPAVLASIYRDLTLLKDQLITGHKPACPTLGGALNLLQLWIWERFSRLRPCPKKAVSPGTPRAAAWQDIGKQMGFSLRFSFVVSVLESPEFQWHPYREIRDPASSLYNDDGRWVNCVDAAQDDEQLCSLAMCLRDCELVGLDCVEQYWPHRVARQFGLDQNVPWSVPRANSRWEEAWSTYAIDKKNVRFYVPARRYRPGVTREYSVWWKSCERKESKVVAGRKRHIELPSRCSSETKKKKKGVDEYWVAHCSDPEDHHESSSAEMLSNSSPNDQATTKYSGNRISSGSEEPEVKCNKMENKTAARRAKELAEATHSLEEMKARAVSRLREVEDGNAEAEKLEEEAAIFQEVAKDLEFLANVYSESAKFGPVS